MFHYASNVSSNTTDNETESNPIKQEHFIKVDVYRIKTESWIRTAWKNNKLQFDWRYLDLTGIVLHLNKLYYFI